MSDFGSDLDGESPLDEKPSDFLASIGVTGGRHDGQAIVPEGDHYKCWCSCGEWLIEAPTEEQGLHLARVHTGSAELSSPPLKPGQPVPAVRLKRDEGVRP